MSDYSQRVRWHVNVSSKTIGVDILTAATARVLKPGILQFEVGLFSDEDGDPLDITGLASLTLSIKPLKPRTATAQLTQTLEAIGLNDALTLEEWDGGATEDCHALFQFAAEDTDFDLGGEEKLFYVVLHGVTDGEPAAYPLFANGTLVIEESGVKLPEPPA